MCVCFSSSMAHETRCTRDISSRSRSLSSLHYIASHVSSTSSSYSFCDYHLYKAVYLLEHSMWLYACIYIHLYMHIEVSCLEREGSRFNAAKAQRPEKSRPTTFPLNFYANHNVLSIPRDHGIQSFLKTQSRFLRGFFLSFLIIFLFYFFTSIRKFSFLIKIYYLTFLRSRAERSTGT